MAPAAWNISGHTGRIFMKIDISVFFENLQINTRFIKI
jgi:hypothetical protein